MRPTKLFLTLAVGTLLLTCALVLVGGDQSRLIQLVWGALGLVAFLDLFLSRTGRSISAEVDVPAQIFVGTEARLAVNLTSTSGPLPSDLAVRFDMSDALRTTYFDIDTSSTTSEIVTPITALKRGLWSLHRVWLSWKSRFGLFEIITKKPINAEVRGIPNIQPVQSGEITTQVKAQLFGLKSTAARGEGSEFHQLRDFTTGMDPRMIDWKRSARHGDLVARETHVEQNHQIIMCVDNGYLMRAEIDGLPKIDCAINAALATTWAAGIGGDQVGFYSFDGRPRLYLPPAPGRQAFNRIRAEAAELKYSSVETNHTLALAHLNGLLNRRSLIIVFSDFVDSITAELMVENMAVLNRQHLLIFVALKDPALEKLVNPDDPDLDAVAMAVSAQQIHRERQIVLDQLRRLGILCLDIDPKGVTPELVSTYIDIKAREMI